MHMAVDADDLLDMGGNRSQIVRYHDDGHFVVELLEQRVKLLLEPVVDEIGRFVQNQQFRIGNQSPPEQGPLQLSARQGADRPSGDDSIPQIRSRFSAFSLSAEVYRPNSFLRA